MKPNTGEIYRHFKGKHYRVITVARHSENWDEELVIYQSLDEPEHISARSLSMWTEEVSKAEYNNYVGPRFIKIKPMKGSKLQNVLFEITLIFLVISNFAIFQVAEVGSYGYILKIFSVVLLAFLVLDLGMRIGKR